MVQPTPVHYTPNPQKWHKDRYGCVRPIQNIPILVTFPKEADEGLWGGEGLIDGISRKNNDSHKPDVARLWKPRLQVRVFYSEILDRWMSITVTPRTLDLVDQSYGFDNYILQTHQVDLASQLGMKLKREMLLTLVRKSMYPDNPKKRDTIYEKYKHFVIPEEEAEWIGLTIIEAEVKQLSLEDQNCKSIQPLKDVYMKELVQLLKENRLQDIQIQEPEKWWQKYNPFIIEKDDDVKEQK